MKPNMGLVDRIVRIALAVTVAVLFAAGQLSLAAAIVLGALALVFVVTSIAGVCPLYIPLHLSTRRKTAA